MSTPPPPQPPAPPSTPSTATNIAIMTTPSTTTTNLANIATPSSATSSSSTTAKGNSPSKSTLFSAHRDPPKSLRGLNKPKCSQCGNVARSRCPFLSCKSCCSKAENPCPIHVLKHLATVNEKPPTTTSSSSDQKPTEASSLGTSLRVSSLRQLSQFNGTPRARRPLTKKDAVALNEWRFAKLKEYRESNIAAENEAFDRYMQNVSLLEETFSVNGSLENPLDNKTSTTDATSTKEDENVSKMILGFKAQLRSNPIRVEHFRKRIQDVVDQGLRELRKRGLNNNEETNNTDNPDGPNEKRQKTNVLRAERSSAFDELIEKLNKVRNEEDLQACVEMKNELFNQHKEPYLTAKDEAKAAMEKTSKGVTSTTGESNSVLPRLWNKVEINQDTLCTIDTHFSSLDQIEDL